MDAKASYQINGLDCPTGAIGAFENIGDFPQLSNQESDPTNENPGALAGATGADLHTITFVSTEYRKRAEAATDLCHAIADCDPEDAIVILDAALTDLRQKLAFDGNPHFAAAVAQYRAARDRSGRVA